MRLRSHTIKGHEGRCEDDSPCPGKRSRNDLEKNTKVTQPKVKQRTSQKRAEGPSKRSLINIENELKSTTMTGQYESPGPSQNNNEKIEPLDSNNASSSSFQQVEDHFIPLESLPSVQAVFSIPKVRERIFSFMNPRDLLRLRLVSRDWRRDATNKALLSGEKNIISLSKETVSRRFLSKNKHESQQFKQPAQQLTELMNKTGSYPFPCSQFSITLTNWNNEEEIQSFLATHGFRIHKLTFNLKYRGDCKETANKERCGICSHQQNWLFQMLSKLLFHQAPNLEKIKISFDIFGPTKKACKPIVDNFIIDQTPQVLHTKLRSAEISTNIPVSMFDFICRIATNLTDLKCTNLNYYLDPINRLYLLKDLVYFPDEEPEENLLIKRIANTNEKLSLQDLCIQFGFGSSEVPEDWPEIADIINKLLEKSCHSLKKLEMNAAELLPGLKFPLISNVNAIGFLPSEGQTHFFPREICLPDTFPKLTNLYIQSWNCRHDDFFLISSNKEVFYSVREIKLNWHADDFDLEKCQRWFPNAKFVVHKVGEWKRRFK